MTTHRLFDTSVYSTILRDATFAQMFRPRYVRNIPFTHYSAVVIHELLAGARILRQRRQAALLYEPFERVRCIVTPSHLVRKEAAAVVATVFEQAPQLQSKISPGLLHDIRIALSGRAIGATVVTRNGADFRLLQQYRPFTLEVI